MTKQHNQTLRTFIHSLLAAGLIAAVLHVAGRSRWAGGFVIGSGLSLFSLYSLKVCVPALFRPASRRYATALMQAALLLKLPLYGVGLYLATRLGTEASFAAFAGCALVPLVISLEAVGKAIWEANPVLRREAAMRAQAADMDAERAARHAADRKAEALEPMILSTQARTAREGAA